MKVSADVVVLGGGVIGLTTAFYLAGEGCQVTVLDQGAMGQEASWAGAGILPPGNPQQARSPFDQLRAHSSILFPTLSVELQEITGIDNGYRRSGGVELLAATDHAHQEEWRGQGIEAELLSESELLRLEPQLAPGLGQAYFLPGMAQVRNPRHLNALAAACIARGVTLRPGEPLREWIRQGNRIRGVRTPLGEIEGHFFLLAAGAWSDGLLDPLGIQLGIRPVRGQMVLLQAETHLFRRILLWGSRYLVPRLDGRILIGSTEEEAGFDKRTTAQALVDLLEMGIALVPGLAGVPVERNWAGLRPGSRDGLPFIGPAPGWDNLFLAAGHFRAGLQLSPGTALVVKELILGKPTSIELAPFRLSRN